MSVLLGTTAAANAQPTSGSCGANATWSYSTSTKVLTISGTGAMANYGYGGIPWKWYFTQMTSVRISLGVTTIGSFAFAYSNLASVTIPSSVTTIGDCAFVYCSNLTSVTIPSSVTTIGREAFTNCWRLASVTIPEGVTTIDDATFNGCRSLESVTIPSSVTTIGDRAFSGCTGLTRVYNLNPTPQSIGSRVFSDVTINNVDLYVIGNTAQTLYSSAPVWQGFKEVLVIVVPATGVTLETTASLTAGGTLQLTATVEPNNATNQGVTWVSSTPSIASVDGTGKVTAVAVGTATITVTTDDGSYAATCTVTVSVAVTSVSLNKSTLSLLVDSTETLTATIAPDTATNKAVTWSSSDTTIATVDTIGVVTALAAGTAVITATTLDGSYTATCDVTVTPVAVTGVTLNKSTLSLTVGANEPLIPTIAPSNATQKLTAIIAPTNATNKDVTWTSSNTSVATVATDGRVTAKTAGTATITVTTDDGSYTADCAVTVSTTGGSGDGGTDPDPEPEPDIDDKHHLSNVVINGVPIFSSGTTEYKVTLPCGEKVAHIVPTPSPDATIISFQGADLNGRLEIAKAGGTGTATIRTVASDGTTQNYTVTVTRPFDLTIIVQYWNDILAVDQSKTKFAHFQWKDASGNPVGTDKPYLSLTTHKLSLTGTYNVELTKEDGQKVPVCGDIKTKALSVISTLTAYPNPVHSTVTVSNPDYAGIRVIELFDINGQLVGQYPSALTSHIDVSALPSGIYVLRAGRQTQKIIIE
ncbi:hypothetical protein FACS1894199_18610 [Bacteroidia bacterium]|nr:hypothetical protein FACS1894199_18610 [Bacteroidia bacterium]